MQDIHPADSGDELGPMIDEAMADPEFRKAWGDLTGHHRAPGPVLTNETDYEPRHRHPWWRMIGRAGR